MTNTKSLASSNRRYDIEYLRIIAVLLLVPFHCAMVFFSYESFYVKSPSSHCLLDYFVFFLSPWHMPLLFVIAGMSSFYALQKRSWKQYLEERTQRLFIPFGFAILFIVPPQPYLAYLKDHPDVTLWTFVKQYFFQIQGDFSGYTGYFTPAHMWFVLYLYFFSIISLPLFLKIKQNSMSIGKYFAKYYILLLYPIIIGLADQLPAIGSKNPFYYYTYFLIGFIFASNSEIEKSLNTIKLFALISGIITTVVYLYFVKISFTFEKYSSQDVLFYILRRFNAWFWLILILGYGKEFLNFFTGILPYASEMSYPFYILHQTIIIILAYYFVSYKINVLIIFFTLVVLSFVITFVIYHFLIRKYKIFRFLFGMKNKKVFGEIQNE